MQVQTAKRLFNVKDYHKMSATGILESNARVELIKGEIINMSPIKSFHASVLDQLVAILFSSLSQELIVRIQNPLHIDDFSEPEPDIALVKKAKDKYRFHHPTALDTLLLIEISDSSLVYDQTVKKDLYAQAGIPEYWIINLRDQQIEIFSQLQNSAYQKMTIVKKTAVAYATNIFFEVNVSELF